MNTVVDPEKFDVYQQELLAALMCAINEQLKTTSLPAGEMRAVTEKITFRVACILDASHMVHAEGVKIDPVVCFGVADDEGNLSGLLTGHHPGSFMHEYVYDVSAEIFGESSP